MARIAGVNLPTNKRVVIALTYIHGIGSFKAKQIAEKLGIDPAKPFKQGFTDPHADLIARHRGVDGFGLGAVEEYKIGTEERKIDSEE